jgi:hypothetical protein
MLYCPEAELEEMLLRQIAGIKDQFPGDWSDPRCLAAKLGLRFATGALGDAREGAAMADLVVVNSESRRPERQLFTAYHEIVHHLLRQNDELVSCLHDQYRADKDHDRFVELLCNVGAAEFLIPRAIVRDTIGTQGFSLSVYSTLKASSDASISAICIQLVRCATQRCAMVVCRLASSANDFPLIPSGPGRTAAVLRVTLAITSPSMKYHIARDTPLPRHHLLAEAYESSGEIVRGEAALLFRHSSDWVVECEAMRLGSPVFGLFHIDPPPPSNKNQLRLF